MAHDEGYAGFEEVRGLLVQHVAEGVLTFDEAREELRAISLRWGEGSLSG
jgi:hypothetical protein